MKDGLRTKLNDWIKAEGGKLVPIDAIERQVKLWGYKISNYERRLRPSESPDIERVFKNGVIVGYKLKSIVVYGRNPSQLFEVCCYSVGVFGTHDRNCETLKKKAAEGVLF